MAEWLIMRMEVECHRPQRFNIVVGREHELTHSASIDIASVCLSGGLLEILLRLPIAPACYFRPKLFISFTAVAAHTVFLELPAYP